MTIMLWFKGYMDEFVLFEQALPKPLVELYEDIAPTGDEMGLMAYLPFEESYTNANGIIEQQFSVNDRRVFKDANGIVLKKADETGVYKIIENDHVVIIRNNERYDVTGKKL